jgi:putative protease
MATSPEILAPVGTWDMLRAAVHNGADAVYIGMPGFNARGRTATLSTQELGAMIEYAHLYGVKVFLAFNILIFEQELKDVVSLLQEILPLKPDACIVQDIGLVRLLRFMAPELEVHASTQMTITNSLAIDLTADLGMPRYVLARELSLSELASIRAETTKELEVFVHGALCVSYSGQCLTSESLGGRSANRGQCAQSCRLDYELLADGEKIDLGAKQYLVSPQDLCGLDDAQILATLGIESFKIEGRLKSAEYVASTVRSYKAASQGLLADTRACKNDMARIFSRGFFNGWFNGVNHQKLVNPLLSSHHGLLIGTVDAVTSQGVRIVSSDPVVPGDGVVFTSTDTQLEIGGSVFSASRDGSGWKLAFDRDFDLRAVKAGMLVYVNASPQVQAEYRRAFLDKSLFRKIPIQMVVTGELHAPLRVRVTDPDGIVVDASSASNLEPAASSPLTQESLRDALGALGGTVYSLETFDAQIPDSCFLHSRHIKEMRRAVCRELDAKRLARPDLRMCSACETLEWISGQVAAPRTPTRPHLTVLIRELRQLDALQGLPISTVYLDFEFGKEYGPAAERVRAMGYRVGIATTRILKPGENAHLKVIQRLRPDEVLVRNLGALQFFRDSGLTLVGDFSLNISNSLTAAWFAEKGITRFTPSYDLNSRQLLDLLEHVDPGQIEITAHQYIPAFHMEHCVFAAFLSTGTSFKDCGRPCEKHRVELRDRTGALHPLKPDAECRNTMFNGVPQSAISLFPDLVTRGVASFRIEGLFEEPEILRAKVLAYADALLHNKPKGDVLTKLGVVERYGVTDGQLYNINSYKDRKKPFAPLRDLQQSPDPGIRRIVEE